MVTRCWRTSLTAVAIVFAAATLAACGGGKASTGANTGGGTSTQVADGTPNANPGEVVIRVNGDDAVTRAQISHWMTSLAGSTYFYVSHGLTMPEGLLSDPANYQRCVAALEATASKSPLGHARENAVELLTKCRELYQVVKADATRYVINAQLNIQLAKQLGVVAKPAQVQALFEKAKAREYPTEAALHAYLTSRRETIADVLLETQVEVLGKALSGKLQSSQGLAQFAALRQRAIAKTSCAPGYSVEGCAGYKPPVTNRKIPAPSALMEQVSAMTTGWCYDLRGCGKQIGK